MKALVLPDWRAGNPQVVHLHWLDPWIAPALCVRWRQLGQNISSARSPMARQKLKAATQFIAWVADFLDAHPPQPHEPTRQALMAAALDWLRQQRNTLGLRFWPDAGLQHPWHLRRAASGGVMGAAMKTAYLDLRMALRGW